VFEKVFQKSSSYKFVYINIARDSNNRNQVKNDNISISFNKESTGKITRYLNPKLESNTDGVIKVILPKIGAKKEEEFEVKFTTNPKKETDELANKMELVNRLVKSVLGIRPKDLKNEGDLDKIKKSYENILAGLSTKLISQKGYSFSYSPELLTPVTDALDHVSGLYEKYKKIIAKD
jgi:hypothetical protein